MRKLCITLWHKRLFRWLRRAGGYIDKEASFPSAAAPRSPQCLVLNGLTGYSPEQHGWHAAVRTPGDRRDVHLPEGQHRVFHSCQRWLEKITGNSSTFLNKLPPNSPWKSNHLLLWMLFFCFKNRWTVSSWFIFSVLFFLKAGRTDPHSCRQPSTPCALQQQRE